MAAGVDRSALRDARRVVVKLGTSVVARPDGRLAVGRVGAIAEQVEAWLADGRQVVLVSSGAVGLGVERLGLSARPTGVVERQACAAVGQGALVAFWDAVFGRLGRRVAQVLLTEDDFHVRRRHVHLASTLERLLELGVVPVVNENDTVSTAEIALHGARVFGDNDRLSALVAAGVGADLLVLLSDVDAVYDRPPTAEGAQRVPMWQPGMTVELGEASAQGRGGMGAKLGSAERAAEAGVHAVIAGGGEPDVLARITAGEDLGTWVPAQAGRSRRQTWLALASAPTGRLICDAGARHAVVRRGASLLAPGVVAVEGAFAAGEVVSLVGPDGEEFARGRVDREAAEVLAPAEGRTRPVVHRDHVVVLVSDEDTVEEDT